MKPTEIEDRVRQITWPAPSAGLRDSVLSAAVVAREPITWSDRMWFSRACRLSALAASLGIVVLDQLSGSRRPAEFTATTQSLAEARVIDETGRQVGLPPDVAAALARRALSAASRRQTPPASGSAWFHEFELEGAGGRR